MHYHTSWLALSLVLDENATSCVDLLELATHTSEEKSMYGGRREMDHIHNSAAQKSPRMSLAADEVVDGC